MRNEFIDTSAALEALDFITKNTPRPLADSLNRMGRTFVIGAKGVKGAMQLTPKADKGKILKDLDKSMGGSAGGEGARIYRNQYGTFSRRSSRRLGKGPKKLVTILAINRLKKAGQRVTEDSVIAMEKKITRQRVSAAGYTAYAGWNNAAKAFGGTGLRKGVTGSQKKMSKYGTGHKAIPTNLVAELTNTAPAIEAIGFPAAQKALDNASADGMAYAQKKVQQLLDKVSAK